jgi:hypothetical protein
MSRNTTQSCGSRWPTPAGCRPSAQRTCGSGSRSAPAPARIGAYWLKGHTGWLELDARCRLDVSVPEGAPRPRQHARSKRIAVSARLTPRRDHRWLQLHQALGGRTSFEAHPERLALERTGHL